MEGSPPSWLPFPQFLAAPIPLVSRRRKLSLLGLLPSALVPSPPMSKTLVIGVVREIGIWLPLQSDFRTLA
ncbi:unnamed protein product [Cuscuta campestris]|uniref:Uncharacterized protein n=1 Tax=Cuscuta campestris TaxID=132261 RepID=A0A484LPP2_9ASTE|nr:unnamed protein product [Cuscuta campestris]